MRLIFTAFALCWGLSGAAQTIPVPFQKLEPQRPFLFQDKPNNRLVWLFYPEKSRASRKYPCHAVETDTLARAILRTGPVGYLEERDELEETPFRQVCSHAAGSNFYGVAVNGRFYQTMKVNGADLSLSVRQLLKLSDKQRYLTAVSLGERSALLTTEVRKKESDLLHVYLLAGDSVAAHKVIPLDENAAMLADKDFNPVVAQDLLELSPHKASINKRVFTDGNKIWVTEDLRPSVSEAGYTRIFALDLTEMTLKTARATCGDKRTSNSERAKLASCIFEGKLFQMLVHEDFIQFTVRELATHKLFWEKTHRKDEPLDFLNAPAKVPSSIYGEKNVATTDKLCNALSWADPFLFVRRTGDGYLLHLGGYRNREGEMTTVAVLFGLAGALVLSATGWSPEDMVSTYMLVDAATFERRERFYPQTLLQRCGEKMSDLHIQGKDRAQGLYQIGPDFYLGHFVEKGRVYELNDIGEF